MSHKHCVNNTVYFILFIYSLLRVPRSLFYHRFSNVHVFMVVDVIVLGEDAAGVVPRHARLLAVALHRGLPPPPVHRGQVQLRTVDIVDSRYSVDIQ